MVRLFSLACETQLKPSNQTQGVLFNSAKVCQEDFKEQDSRTLPLETITETKLLRHMGATHILRNVPSPHFTSFSVSGSIICSLPWGKELLCSVSPRAAPGDLEKSTFLAYSSPRNQKFQGQSSAVCVVQAFTEVWGPLQWMSISKEVPESYRHKL